MIHEGDRVDKEIKRLEHELGAPIDPRRRDAVAQAIQCLKQKKRSLERPH